MTLILTQNLDPRTLNLKSVIEALFWITQPNVISFICPTLHSTCPFLKEPPQIDPTGLTQLRSHPAPEPSARPLHDSVVDIFAPVPGRQPFVEIKSNVLPLQPIWDTQKTTVNLNPLPRAGTPVRRTFVRTLYANTDLSGRRCGLLNECIHSSVDVQSPLFGGSAE